MSESAPSPPKRRTRAKPYPKKWARKPKPKPPAKRGRPPFEATEQHRGSVRALAATGYDQEFIAGYLGIGVDTLVKNFERELKYARAELLGQATSALAAALNPIGPRGKRLKPESWAVKFVLATQGKSMGWTERVDHEHTGPNGGGIPLRLESLSDAQLGQLIERVEVAITARQSESGTGASASGAD